MASVQPQLGRDQRFLPCLHQHGHAPSRREGGDKECLMVIYGPASFCMSLTAAAKNMFIVARPFRMMFRYAINWGCTLSASCRFIPLSRPTSTRSKRCLRRHLRNRHISARWRKHKKPWRTNASLNSDGSTNGRGIGGQSFVSDTRNSRKHYGELRGSSTFAVMA